MMASATGPTRRARPRRCLRTAACSFQSKTCGMCGSRSRTTRLAGVGWPRTRKPSRPAEQQGAARGRHHRRCAGVRAASTRPRRRDRRRDESHGGAAHGPGGDGSGRGQHAGHEGDRTRRQGAEQRLGVSISSTSRRAHRPDATMSRLIRGSAVSFMPNVVMPHAAASPATASRPGPPDQGDPGKPGREYIAAGYAGKNENTEAWASWRPDRYSHGRDGQVVAAVSCPHPPHQRPVPVTELTVPQQERADRHAEHPDAREDDHPGHRQRRPRKSRHRPAPARGGRFRPDRGRDVIGAGTHARM